VSTERIASARLALNQALMAGADTAVPRAALKKLLEAEAAKPKADPAAQEAAQRAAQAVHEAQIQRDAERLLEARNARIAVCVKSFEVKRV
jgi:hypothetical protein